MTATRPDCGPPVTPTASELLRRIKGLPGFGEVKAQIFLALLGKQYGVTPKGWRAAAGDFGQAGTHISVADIVDAQSMGEGASVQEADESSSQGGEVVGHQKGRATT